MVVSEINQKLHCNCCGAVFSTTASKARSALNFQVYLQHQRLRERWWIFYVVWYFPAVFNICILESSAWVISSAHNAYFSLLTSHNSPQQLLFHFSNWGNANKSIMLRDNVVLLLEDMSLDLCLFYAFQHILLFGGMVTLITWQPLPQWRSQQGTRNSFQDIWAAKTGQILRTGLSIVSGGRLKAENDTFLFSLFSLALS